MPEVKLSPNIPAHLTLLNPEGELDDRYKLVHYQTDGGTLTLSYRIAEKLNILELKPGEKFGICKRTTDGRNINWDIWLLPETEQSRAAEEATEQPTDIEVQLEKSLQAVPLKEKPRAVPRKPIKRDTPQIPFEWDRGNGTYGPQPRRAVATASPVRIPYNIAFAEVTKFVTEGLSLAGEQWNDQAKQDMVSTILIAAAKQGLLCLWERG